MFLRAESECADTTCAPAADIQGLYWSKTAQGCQLSVQRSQERLVQLTGFREKARPRQTAPECVCLKQSANIVRVSTKAPALLLLLCAGLGQLTRGHSNAGA